TSAPRRGRSSEQTREEAAAGLAGCLDLARGVASVAPLRRGNGQPDGGDVLTASGPRRLPAHATPDRLAHALSFHDTPRGIATRNTIPQGVSRRVRAGLHDARDTVAPSIHTGAHPGGALEQPTEECCVLVADVPADGFHRVFGPLQTALRFVDADSLHVGERTEARGVREAPFEGPH